MIDKNLGNKSFSVGVFTFVNKYYEKLNLQQIFGCLKLKGIPINKIVEAMITFKIEHNLSIHKCGEWINNPYILQQFQLNKFNERALYRALEIIGQNYSFILSDLQNKIFSKYNFKHTDANIDWSSLVLYGNASPLGKFGYSSEHRPDKKQITFGVGELRNPVNVPFILTIKEGNVPSKVHFKDTFSQSAKYLQPNSLIVIDRGANTKENKALVKSNNMDYLTARILSNNNKKIISLFSKDTAKKITRKRNGKLETVFCKKIKQENEFLFICFSELLYSHHIKNKEKKINGALEIIRKLSGRLGEKKIKANQIDLPDKILIHEITVQKRLINLSVDKIRKELRNSYINGREGYYVLESSKNLTEKEAIEIYKSRDSIEKTISSLKNEIEIKPVRVWTESGIKGALLIGFLAQLFISLARYDNENLKRLSTTTILHSLKNLTLTIKTTKNSIIEQIISNIDHISMEILPNLTGSPG